MKIITIDIESIPTQKDGAWEEIRKNIKPPATYKKAESIDKWMDNNADAEADTIYHKTGLDGTMGEIICIGYSVNDEPAKCVSRTLEEPESELLSEFMTELSIINDGSGFMWIGHNHTGFDLRFIYQRCVINNVMPLIKIPYQAKPWDASVFDTMVEWRGLSGRGAGKLDVIAQALGMDGKDGIDGSKVWEAIKNGEYERVNEYCKRDVEMTREIYKRMNFINTVKGS